MRIRSGASGQPKRLSFGFRPKFTLSVITETFRQIFPFCRKRYCGRNALFRPKWSISAERIFFRPKEHSFGRKRPLSVTHSTRSAVHWCPRPSSSKSGWILHWICLDILDNECLSVKKIENVDNCARKVDNCGGKVDYCARKVLELPVWHDDHGEVITAWRPQRAG